jgi:opacity protein-like surface antigen
MQMRAFLLLSLLALGGLGAHAGSGPSLLPIYVGVGYGNTTYKGEPNNFPALLPGQSLKEDSKFYELYLGLRLNEFLAIEGGYAQFGQVEADYKNDPDWVSIISPKDKEKVDFNRYGVSAILEYPVALGFSVFGIVGVSYYEFDKTLYGGFSPIEGDLEERIRKQTYGLEYGFGAKYTLLGRVAIRGQWTRPEISEVELSSFRLSAEIHF